MNENFEKEQKLIAEIKQHISDNFPLGQMGDEVVYKGKKRYRARINVPGYYIVGYYHSEFDAAIAYNKAIDILKKNGV